MPEQPSVPEKVCFIIGPIGDVGSEVRDHADFFAEYIVEATVNPLGYKVVRADKIADPGMITDQIIAHALDAILSLLWI